MRRIPTPTAKDADQRKYDSRDGSLYLPGFVERFPTPLVSDQNGAGQSAKVQGGPNLRDYVRHYPTPTVNDAKNNHSPSTRRRSPPLAATVAMDLEAETGDPLDNSLRLSPDWVEALMGLPVGWTDPGKTVSRASCPTSKAAVPASPPAATPCPPSSPPTSEPASSTLGGSE